MSPLMIPIKLLIPLIIYVPSKMYETEMDSAVCVRFIAQCRKVIYFSGLSYYSPCMCQIECFPAGIGFDMYLFIIDVSMSWLCTRSSHL